MSALGGLSAPELGAIAVRAALERSGVDPDSVYEVIMGLVVSAGAGQAPARQAALRGGQWPWVVVLLAGGLAAAAYVFKVLWRTLRAEHPPATHAVPVTMELVPLGLALVAIALGLVARAPLELLSTVPPLSTSLW